MVGYSVMKMEFEKLLDAINSLEDEKKELESELERVKKLPGGNTTSNTAAAERVRDRFLKVRCC
jgi:predicted  nucleic acid-binding Zn-ribbon protein